MTAGELTWEIAKGLGSVAGFFSTVYILYDRILKHVPTAVLVPRPIVPGSQNIAARLSIKNVAARPILVAWDRAQGSINLAKDDSTRGIISSLFPGESVIAIDAAESRELIVLKPRDYNTLDADAPLTIIIRWKFAQPIFWQPARKLKVWIRKKDFSALINDDLKELDDAKD